MTVAPRYGVCPEFVIDTVKVTVPPGAVAATSAVDVTDRPGVSTVTTEVQAAGPPAGPPAGQVLPWVGETTVERSAPSPPPGGRTVNEAVTVVDSPGARAPPHTRLSPVKVSVPTLAAPLNA